MKHAPSILVGTLALSLWVSALPACDAPAVGKPPAVMCGLDNPRGMAFGGGGDFGKLAHIPAHHEGR